VLKECVKQQEEPVRENEHENEQMKAGSKDSLPVRHVRDGWANNCQVDGSGVDRWILRARTARRVEVRLSFWTRARQKISHGIRIDIAVCNHWQS
jgi:hypothetical protein